MQCLVMAGGLGTRMAHLTSSMPKAMIPVCGEPFIRHQLRNLQSFGINHVVISTGYLGEQIHEEVSTNAPSGMSVVCVPDGPELLGTGGAVRRLVSMGVLDDVFLYTYGDSFLTIDHQIVARAFNENIADALMTVCDNAGGHEPSNAIVSGSMVTLYRKGHPSGEMQWIDYGLSVVTTDAIVRHLPGSGSCDIAQMFEALSLAGRLQAYVSSERYFEIGSIAGLDQLERHLNSGNSTV